MTSWAYKYLFRQLGKCDISEFMRVEKEVYVRSSGDEYRAGIRPVFQDFHFLRMKGHYEYPIHQHENYEVILVDRGPYRCFLNGEEITIGKHEVLIIKPGDQHGDHLENGQRHYVLHFLLTDGFQPKASMVNLFNEWVVPSGQVCVNPMSDETRTFYLLEQESGESDCYAASIQDAMLEAFFWRLVRNLPVESLSPQFRRRSAEQQFSSRLYRLFEEHVQQNLRVEELAFLMKISKRSLSMKCRALLGNSPAQLFTRFKIQKAVRLLTHTDQPIKEISYDLGFENPYHFSRVFKRIHGMTPSAVRLRNQTP